jgi:hypothetical protein
VDDAMDHIAGQMGKNRDDAPEQLAGMEQYTGQLCALAGTLTAPATPADPGGNFYVKSWGTNVPPLPFNPLPGYPTVQEGNKITVDDTITDLQLISRAFELMATTTMSPPGIGEEYGTNSIP